ncbi:MAG: putative Zn-dependent peptidase [Hyphomicrobiaceae bacterium]
MNEAVRTTTLTSGVRVATEAVPGTASVAIGFLVDTGSAHESAAENGVSHFIEHLVFKGTKRRSPRRIAEEIESLGGSINAFTGKEQTCFHARIAAEHLAVAVDVLADLLTGALLRSDDVELERDVVLQEILEVEDTPDDYVHDFHLERYWPGTALGRPVAGSVESVTGLSLDAIKAYRARHYCADRLIVAAAGNVDHDALVALLEPALSGIAIKGEAAGLIAVPKASAGVFASGRDLEQVHVVFGTNGLRADDPRHEAAEVLITALGGGMSSRLFQSVREERGLAYSIYAFHSAFAVAGYSGVYAAVPRNSAAELVELVLAELAEVADKGLSADEVDRTRNQLIGGIPLALESTENRMFRLARDLAYFGKTVPLDETIEQIRRVTPEDTRVLASELFERSTMSIALHGEIEATAVPAPMDAA